MKKILVLCAIPLFLSSCFTVSFLEPQPQGVENLSDFPDKLIGNYLADDDTVVVTHKSYTMENETFYISDSVVVKKFKKFYVVSVREEQTWTVMLVEQQKSGDLAMYSISNDDYPDGANCNKDSLIAEMKKICKVKKRDHGYFAKPSKKEFKKLIKKDIFRPAGDLIKME
ncbi:MAG: hypothetical protein JKX73_07965 [Flavobacteriales bacterium]|nr:hypothetical protein [Flavobacteriales bacterium]